MSKPFIEARHARGTLALQSIEGVEPRRARDAERVVVKCAGEK
jgi:hypothetical protein